MVGESSQVPGSERFEDFKFVHEHPQEFSSSETVDKVAKKVDKVEADVREVKEKLNELGAAGVNQ